MDRNDARFETYRFGDQTGARRGQTDAVNRASGKATERFSAASFVPAQAGCYAHLPDFSHP
jgi:hypothetical protein